VSRAQVREVLKSKKRDDLHAVLVVLNQRFGSPDGVSPAATIYSLSDLPKTVTSLDGAGPHVIEEKSN